MELNSYFTDFLSKIRPTGAQPRSCRRLTRACEKDCWRTSTSAP